MTFRLGLRELSLGILLSILVGLLLISPFAAHTYLFVRRLRKNEEKWRRQDISRYQMEVASNSHQDCTGGWNQLIVEDGKLIEGENIERGGCAPIDFEELTVKALFARIWEECVNNRSLRRPFPYCNVAYDDELGFPRRVDTYIFDADSRYPPSITVDRVTVIDN
jgi:hypothetical protein